MCEGPESSGICFKSRKCFFIFSLDGWPAALKTKTSSRRKPCKIMENYAKSWNFCLVRQLTRILWGLVGALQASGQFLSHRVAQRNSEIDTAKLLGRGWYVATIQGTEPWGGQRQSDFGAQLSWQPDAIRLYRFLPHENGMYLSKGIWDFGKV